MARIKIVATQDMTQCRFEKKLHDKQVLDIKSREVSLSLLIMFSLYFPEEYNGYISRKKYLFFLPASTIPHKMWPVIVNRFSIPVLLE